MLLTAGIAIALGGAPDKPGPGAPGATGIAASRQPGPALGATGIAASRQALVARTKVLVAETNRDRAYGGGQEAEAKKRAEVEAAAKKRAEEAAAVSQHPVAHLASLTALRESYSTFSVGSSSTPLTSVTSATHHKGTVFSFGLDQAVTVRVVIQMTANGRRVRQTCKPESRKLRRKPHCTRVSTIATLTRSAHAGLNNIPFSGRISGKALVPGVYRAIFSASNAAGTSAPQSVSFTVVRR
jgi:hypothetical protein